MNVLTLFYRLPALVLIGLVRGYQWCISPVLQTVAGAQCRFEPSCSEYFIQAVKKYGAVSGQVMKILRRFTDLVEPVSIDEAFLDVTASERAFGSGEAIARAVKAAVHAETALTASVGIAPCKLEIGRAHV